MSAISRKIVIKILDDLRGRQGVGNELEQIDNEVMSELIATNAEHVDEILIENFDIKIKEKEQ